MAKLSTLTIYLAVSTVINACGSSDNGTTKDSSDGGSDNACQIASTYPLDFARVGCDVETDLDCQLACLTTICGATVHQLTPEQVKQVAHNYLCQVVVNHSTCKTIQIPADCGGYSGTGGASSTATTGGSSGLGSNDAIGGQATIASCKIGALGCSCRAAGVMCDERLACYGAINGDMTTGTCLYQ